ncbi:flavin-containing monooxygenase [Psychrobacter lutiphocae]|uniref:flavin-containing monooxygenase n=1 Tax=Psychrobacter lutiphocae TaxID=540500 RepID=UPI0003616AAB|nr:NAD(P)/FAD-dependent oxidoreductase [Psychrobacter lutiphocae]
MLSLHRRHKSTTKGNIPHISLRQKLPQLPRLPNLPRRAVAKLRKIKPKLPFIGGKSPQLDILIIGAGISGIAMASHIQRDKLLSQSIKKGRVKIVEKRNAIGGTWDLFKYPGIRSDSDMTTFGFAHRPWIGNKTLADAASIKQYLEQTAQDEAIDRLIQFDTKVIRLDWSSKDQYWTATLEEVTTGKQRKISARFVVGATGYYDYDQGYQPQFKGQDDFTGQIVHPQHWDDKIDYQSKRVVVIGSGATAVTLLPALIKPLIDPNSTETQAAAHVTMLQRTPTYIGSVPSEDPSVDILTTRFKLNPKIAYRLVRGRNILFQQGIYQLAKIAPNTLKKGIITKAKKELAGSGVQLKHFIPDYNPWDERLCAVPDGDLFKALHTGHAEIITDHIDRFTKEGIQLKSGHLLPADIIVTATGLKLQMLGGAQVIIDGDERKVSERMTYKAVMVDDAPNLAVLFGYTNASWTLKIDLACGYITRLLRHMHYYGYTTAVPQATATDGEHVTRQPYTVMDTLTAGYIRRAQNVLPKQGDRYPWIVTNNYLSDIIMLKYHRIEDKWLRFYR